MEPIVYKGDDEGNSRYIREKKNEVQKNLLRECKFLGENCRYPGTPSALTCLQCLFSVILRKSMNISYLNERLQSYAENSESTEVSIISDMISDNISQVIKGLIGCEELLNSSKSGFLRVASKTGYIS